MVKCAICGKEYKLISNTHLQSHNLSIKEYKIQFPNESIISEELRNDRSISMIGKNKGNSRPDAKDRMDNFNPMEEKEVVQKMGESRRKGISEGRIKALDNLGHLPTEKEKIVIDIFQRNNIPLKYVGNGSKWIENNCPDFINEGLKIIVELDLDCFRHEEEKITKESLYWNYGYRLIWLTTINEKDIIEWLSPFFFGLEWEKIEFIKKEKNTGRQKVYNFECIPNNNYFAEGILVHNCFADSFRASLYTSFFDNGKSMGLRHCKPDFFRAELDKLMKFRGKKVANNITEVQKAISLQIPIRLGIRFEDFLPAEGRLGISLNLLQYLKEIGYPTMINTKSNLIGREDYVDVLANNQGESAVHITMISANETLLKKLEPGAPIFKDRIKAAKALSDAGVRVVARIEPLMIFINDEENDVLEWIDAIVGAGVEHITFDTYSWSANGTGVQRQMEMEGFDFERMFLLMSDAQWLGSLILQKFIEYIKYQTRFIYNKEIKCSTFDFGNVPTNDDDICCEVGDLFLSKGAGFSYGNNLMSIRYIKSKNGNSVTWGDYDKFVESKGGWLSLALRNEVWLSWNRENNPAYQADWAPGIEPAGIDEKGNKVWKYNFAGDFREEMLYSVLR